MGLLDGKRLLITGVITDQSIAFSIARLAQEQGAQVVLTGFGRMSLVERVARRLPEPPPVVELDVTNPEHLAALPDNVRQHMDGVDGVVDRPLDEIFRIVSEEKAGCLAVPEAAVIADAVGSETGSIVLVQGDKAVHKSVTLGLREAGLIQIEGEGLKEGLAIVTEDAYAVPDGTKIHPYDAAPKAEKSEPAEKGDKTEKTGK